VNRYYSKEDIVSCATTFTERDEFNRKPIAERLILLLESPLDVSPTVLDGPWGSGKTEFCSKLINLIKEKESKLACVYIDAYKFDHSDDPLVMMISSIAAAIPDEDQKKNYFKKAIPITKVLGKTVAKAGFGWLLKTNADGVLEKIDDALSDGGNDLIDKGVERIFKDFEKVDENLELFKKCLEEITKDKHFLVIIDELDRCKPSFALSVLEKVKHVFEVPGVNFLFSTNTTQLCAVVKNQYGNEIDAEDYLNKFFKFSVKLPDTFNTTRYENKQNSYHLFLSLVQTADGLKHHFSERGSAAPFFEYIFSYYKISLREAETFYNNLLVYNTIAGERAIKENTIWGYGLLLSFGVFLYTFDDRATKRLLNKQFNLEELETILGVTLKDFKSKSNERNIVKAVFAFFISEYKDEVLASLIEPKAMEPWNERIKGLFQEGFDVPDKGSRAEIVANACRTLQLIL